jgi:drug/metabolite transporter (DMT)-like permease
MSATLRLQLMFAYLCVVWGSTWIGMKLGTAVVPPGLFAGLRWGLAGLLMLIALRLRGPVNLPWHLWRRILPVAVLMISLNQLLMMYGLRQVGSGLGAVVNCSLTPLSFLALGVAMRQERLTRQSALAMALGITGILILFGPAALAGRLDGTALLGALLIAFGTLVYCFASLLARPLMTSVSPVLLAGIVNFTGGGLLLLAALVVEPGAWQATDFAWGRTAWLAFAYLVGPAALGATTVYFFLVRDWGASKTGSYAFISPIVAVLLGLWLSGEALHPLDAIGMTLMLAGAAVALRRRA